MRGGEEKERRSGNGERREVESRDSKRRRQRCGIEERQGRQIKEKSREEREDMRGKKMTCRKRGISAMKEE